jgi:hypothetical protein
MDVYKNTKKLNRCTKCFSTARAEQGDICSVDEIQPGVFHITSTAQEAQDLDKPTTFVDVLREWRCCWLWEHISVEGGTDWIAQAITSGSLVAITDGSYIQQLDPHSCSSAFVLECTQGIFQRSVKGRKRIQRRTTGANGSSPNIDQRELGTQVSLREHTGSIRLPRGSATSNLSPSLPHTLQM